MEEKCIHGIRRSFCHICRKRSKEPGKMAVSRGRKRSTSPAVSGRTRGKMAERYLAQLKFMSGLSGERRRLFDAMVAANMKEALMARRYFGLDGHPAVTQKEIAEEFECRQATVSVLISALLMALDPSRPGNAVARERAGSLRRRAAEKGIK